MLESGKPGEDTRRCEGCTAERQRPHQRHAQFLQQEIPVEMDYGGAKSQRK